MLTLVNDMGLLYLIILDALELSRVCSIAPVMLLESIIAIIVKMQEFVAQVPILFISFSVFYSPLPPDSHSVSISPFPLSLSPPLSLSLSLLACTKGSIRLWSAYATTPPSEGMLHYCHNSGEWKAMCKYRWGCQDAKVACRNLGYNGSLCKYIIHLYIMHILFLFSLDYQALYDVEGAYGFYKPVLPQRVTCNGAEPILRSCSFQYTSWCDSALSETAGVKCAENAICKCVCVFDIHTSSLSLSLHSFSILNLSLFFSSFPFFSFPSFLLLPPFPSSLAHGCTPGAIRVQDGADSSEGRLEFCYHDEWSPFCVLDDEEAAVACKQLGYTTYNCEDLQRGTERERERENESNNECFIFLF